MNNTSENKSQRSENKSQRTHRETRRFTERNLKGKRLYNEIHYENS